MLKISAFAGLSLLLLAGTAWGGSRNTTTVPPKRGVAAQEVLDNGVVIIGGTVERLSWSGPLDWSVDMARATPGKGSELTAANLRELPMARPPANPRPPGLLSMRPQLGSQDFVDSMGIAGAEPSRERLMVGPPGISRAFGGGPQTDFSPDVVRMLDQVPGR